MGIIGTGARGSWLADVMQAIPNIKLIACCDIVPSRLEQGLALADENAKGYSDYRALLNDADVEAVFIATPLSLHFPMAMDALSAGKHVYCEKTMTYNIEEAIELRKRIRSSGLVFQVGYQHRFNPLYHEIKFLIEKGYCGKITKVGATWNRNGDWRRAVAEELPVQPVGFEDMEHLVNWRMYRRYSGGLMAELCSHQIDIVNWMLGSKPKKVVGLGGIDYWKDGRETYDNVHAIFEYANGAKASFSALTSNALLGYSLKFLGDKGSIEIHGEQGHRAKIYAEVSGKAMEIDGVSSATKVAWENHEGVPVRIRQPASDDRLPTENAIKHFAQCVEKKETPFASVDAGYEAALSVHLANEAIQKEITKYWNPDFD